MLSAGVLLGCLLVALAVFSLVSELDPAHEAAVRAVGILMVFGAAGLVALVVLRVMRRKRQQREIARHFKKSRRPDPRTTYYRPGEDPLEVRPYLERYGVPSDVDPHGEGGYR